LGAARHAACGIDPSSNRLMLCLSQPRQQQQAQQAASHQQQQGSGRARYQLI
jgi:hypothetical protein